METNDSVKLEDLKALKIELTRFMMAYKFALEEMNTKINILKEEFHYIHDYNPIEHVSSRLKSPESILKKIFRKGYDFNLHSIKENIRDIAGIRITCSFRSDIFEISKMLECQQDIKVLEYKDYIKNPKPNGYQSLHLILEIPIFMSDRVEYIPVEVQIRTIAMDFWASLEHKIYYKYNKDVPESLILELKDAAKAATDLDLKMERLHRDVEAIKAANEDLESELLVMEIDKERFNLPMQILETFVQYKEKK